MADQFKVAASMTAGDAYDCLPSLLDERSGGCIKLLTTGLIDPDKSLWGARNCRYLGRNLRHPRLKAEQPTASLQRRIEMARRPKIIVAGLSKRIECHFDLAGEYIGAVSTFSIFHPDDDVRALDRVHARLLEPTATAQFVSELGANAMGGGSITMKKKFLENFPY